MDPEEAYGFRFVSGIVSTDVGVYFSMAWIQGNEYRSSIFLMNSDGVGRITFGGNERDPVFNKGILYYVASDGIYDRIMRLAPRSAPETIGRFREIVEFAPYGDGILVVVGENFRSRRPFVIRRLKYKHDSTGLLRRQRTLYYAEGDSIRRIAPSGYDISGVRVSGRRIIVSASRVSDDYGLTDLYDLDFTSGGMVKLTAGSGSIDSFDVSEDGRIAFTGHRSGVRDWAERKLFLLGSGEAHSTGGTAGIFTSTDIYDDAAAKTLFHDGSIYTIGQDGGSTSIYRLSDGKVLQLEGIRHSVRHLGVSSAGLSYSYSDFDHPSVLVTPFGEYDPNAPFTGIKAEYCGSGKIDGWAIVNHKEAPVVLLIHGGPHSAFGPVYDIETQYLAQNGYNVLFCNPRGSMGKGEEFSSGSVGDWGGGDADDILNFLDRTISRYELSGPVAVKGISYGGYMVNWLVTQTSRFRAAISEKGVSNLLSSVGTSDIGYWFDAMEEIGSKDPWSQESIRKFMERSPITYARNAKTPLLIIHGEDDHRCPIEQSEQFFTALKFYGTDTVFVRMQGEGHELANREKAENKKESLLMKKEWLDRYLRGIRPKDSRLFSR